MSEKSPAHPVDRAACKRMRVVEGTALSAPEADWLAVEEPMEIRVRGASYAVLMRTPGRERDLAAGFLAAEGLIHAKDDVTAIERCVNPETGSPEAHIWNVAVAEGVAFDPRRLRQTVVSSSCGLCGARSLEELQQATPKLASRVSSLRLSALQLAFEQLRQSQSLFEATAGSHGAALWDPQEDQLLDVAEDVGRHNAVDKLLGAQLRADHYPVSKGLCLLISGRISFELVQKAALAGVPILAGVGMPTSLAVDAARETGQALLGWVRNAGANIYAGEINLV